MSAKKIEIVEVIEVDGRPVVRGTVDGEAFEASPKRWGSKMLMNVLSTSMDRGARIAVGRAAKKAVKGASMTLPAATLVRPRKPNVEAAPTPVKIDLTGLTVPGLRAIAKAQGRKGYSDMNRGQLLALLAA